MMYARVAVAAVLLALAGSVAGAPEGFMETPHGIRAKKCVHSVPSGSTFKEVGNTVHVTFPDGTVLMHGPCTDGAAMSDLKFTADDDVLPPDYDGWLEYTAYKLDQGFNKFNGYFSVPDVPEATPQALFIFTGLQNVNWIPKVDHTPSQPFDIIQPVLQFPGLAGRYWSVRSWYVTLHGNTYASNEIRVDPGDKIFGIMERKGPQSWLIASIVNGQSTNYTADNERLVTQPWAYTTVECYGCTGCSTYPMKPCLFTDMTFTDATSQPVTVDWEANPTPAKDRKCKEYVDIKSSADLTYGFQ